MKPRPFLVGDKVEIVESGEIGVVELAYSQTCLVVAPSHSYYYDNTALKKLPALKMAVDPLIKATKAAYRASEVFKLDQLLEEETRWKRKATIAQNKLADVRERINRLAKELAQPKTEDKKP